MTRAHSRPLQPTSLLLLILLAAASPALAIPQNDPGTAVTPPAVPIPAPQEKPGEGEQEKPGEGESEKPGEGESDPEEEGDDPAETDDDAVLEEKKAPSFDFSGFLSASYRMRARGSRNDEDLFGYVSLDGGDPNVHDVTFHLFARGTFDLEGNVENSGIFSSLNDVFGESFNGRVYEAYVDLQRDAVPTSLGIERIRLGRQNVYAAFNYLLDGARLDFAPIKSLGKMRISVYGGLPEYFYESSRTGDWLAGTDINFRPFDGTRIDLRYVHVQDDARYRNNEVDDYTGLTVRQRVTDNLFMTGEWNLIDVATRDVRLGTSWDLADEDLSVRFDYRYQNDIQREFTTVYDPYVVVLGDSFAYHQFDLQISKLFGKHFGVDGGMTGRFLHEDNNESPFNRQYFRAWLTASAFKWPHEDLDLSLTGEIWNANRDETFSFGTQITWRPDPDLRLTLGHDYALYTYDLFTVEERQDATTFFLKVDWDPSADLRVDARYQFETGDNGEFHAALLGLTWSF